MDKLPWMQAKLSITWEMGIITDPCQSVCTQLSSGGLQELLIIQACSPVQIIARLTK